MGQAPSRKYIEQLTWLRGIAAFFVIVSHSMRATEDAYVTGDEALTGTVLALLDLGGYGVALFFVLSGCTLYISNADKLNRINVHKFYIKRVFRIWPAFLVSLVCYILFGLVFASFYPENQGNWIERQFLADYSTSDVFAYVFMVFNLVGPWGLFNNAYWSLPVEFQYYLAFPLMVVLVRYVGLIGPVLLGALIYLVPKAGILDVVNDKVFYMAFTFCCGVSIGWYYNRTSRSISVPVSALLLLVIFLLTSAIKNEVIAMPDVAVISTLRNWYGVMAVLTVLVVVLTRFDFHSRVERLLKYYGTISYSTYLYHNIFVAVAVLLLIRLGIHDEAARVWFVFAFTLVSTWFAAGLSYRYVEQPFIDVGRRIARAGPAPVRA